MLSSVTIPKMRWFETWFTWKLNYRQINEYLDKSVLFCRCHCCSIDFMFFVPMQTTEHGFQKWEWLMQAIEGYWHVLCIFLLQYSHINLAYKGSEYFCNSNKLMGVYLCKPVDKWLCKFLCMHMALHNFSDNKVPVW